MDPRLTPTSRYILLQRASVVLTEAFSLLIIIEFSKVVNLKEEKEKGMVTYELIPHKKHRADA
ncbi:hypothetical protein MITSMUL_05469 [Mitsuokella multacida DSM 20544]|uniref:Uncharacterized protein n=1 Tax=Mitsuokella multacida DSM 20544 TaxID=500635 RepID=C9KQF4_9FIRM|nr:hypothetical protein MITSMUL_05469 [Mitsuokella multacida DSM 20544]